MGCKTFCIFVAKASSVLDLWPWKLTPGFKWYSPSITADTSISGASTKEKGVTKFTLQSHCQGKQWGKQLSVVSLRPAWSMLQVLGKPETQRSPYLRKQNETKESMREEAKRLKSISLRIRDSALRLCFLGHWQWSPRLFLKGKSNPHLLGKMVHWKSDRKLHERKQRYFCNETLSENEVIKPDEGLSRKVDKGTENLSSCKPYHSAQEADGKCCSSHTLDSTRTLKTEQAKVRMQES